MTPSAPAAPRVWLVGARGMLARALARQLAAAARPVLLTDSELDIGERDAVLAFAERERPGLIINAAAYTRVDDAERESALAFRVNADGPAHLAEAARDVGARLLHFSTDYVFDGAARAPYDESAATQPRSVYGQSKLLGEQRVLNMLPDAAFVVRTSWLFGAGGSNFVKTMLNLLRTRQELRVVDDQHGRPTYTEDLADAALALLAVKPGARPVASGVYHFANAGNVSWHGFCLAIRDACLALGEQLQAKRILPVSTQEFPRPAPRPAYSVLDTSKLERALQLSPRPYRAALEDYLRAELASERWPNGRS